MRFYKWVIVLSIGALLVASAVRSMYTITVSAPVVAADINTLPTIIIDPGHGGIDGGAVGVDDIVEKDINLSICLVMRDIFVASGFDVVMTRETDISIHDEGVSGVRAQKSSDLHNRLALVEAHPNAVFISLHQNKFGDSSSRGAQIFHGPNNEKSKLLAEILQQNFVRDLQPDNHRQVKEAGKNLYLMYTAQCPSVLVECGFLSNREEAYQLIDPEYQAKVAFTTYRSVLEFLDLDTPTLLGEAVELSETDHPAA